MSNIKKKWAKTLLVIDLRPIQQFKNNGVNIAGINWIKELIRQSKNDQPILFWTNHKQKIILPQKFTSKQNLTHIHTSHSNTKLLLLNFLNQGPTLDQILNINQPYIYFCPDIRSIKLGPKAIKRCTYFHDVAFHKKSSELSIKSKIWFKLIQPRKIYQKSDQIFTNSKFSLQEIEKLYGPHKTKIQIIHPSLPKNLPLKPELKTPKNYYLFIGTTQQRKGLQSFYKKLNPTDKLYIIGPKDPMFKTQNLPNKPNIKFLKNVNNPAKHTYIKNAKALIYPSTYEGFGLPVLEGIRLQTPIFTHQIKPFTELFSKQINFLSFFPNIKIKPNKPNIFPLSKEVRKLRKHLYHLD